MGILISEGQGTAPPTILKSPEIDPALVKAAEAQKSIAGVPDSTAAGVDIAGATRISQRYGGSTGDYVGLNHYQLADKLGGNPSDYAGFLPGAEPVKAITQSVIDDGGGGAVAPAPSGSTGGRSSGVQYDVDQTASDQIKQGTLQPPAVTTPVESPPGASTLQSGVTDMGRGVGEDEDGNFVRLDTFTKSEVTLREVDQIFQRAAELADIIGLKPSDILRADGTINAAKIADELGGKPSDYKTIDDVLQKSTEIDSGRFKDSVKELLTLGKATTKTFNLDDLGREYDQAVTEASKSGLTLTESKTEFAARILNSQPKTGEVVGDFFVGMTPLVGTVAFWDKMDGKGKALSVGLDILTLIPFAGAVGAGVRAGQGVGRATVKAVIAEAKAPITALARPIDTVKGVLYPIETAVRPGKIPLSALEVQESTVRLGLKELKTDAKTAMSLRDEATMAQIKGANPVAAVSGGPTVQLTNKAINTISPVAVHSTPDIRPFLNGIEIVPGTEGKGLFVAPSLHTRFTKSSAFGLMGGDNAVPGALIIRDSRVLNQLKPSNKIYAGTVEIEATLPAGVRLPKPSQILMTRSANGDKLALVVIGDKYSAAEIAKMKIVGSVDTVRDIFRPSKTIKGGKAGEVYDDLLQNNLKLKQARQEVKTLRKEGKVGEARQASSKAKEFEARRIDLERRAARESTGSLAPAALRFSRTTLHDEMRSAVTRATRTRPAERTTESGGRRVVDETRRRAAPDDRRPPVPDGRRPVPPAERRPVPPGERRIVPPNERRIVPPGERRPPPPDERVVPPGDRVLPPRVNNLTQKGTVTTKFKDAGKGSDTPIKLGDGDVAWRQGLFWIVKRKNGDEDYSKRPPEGAERFDGTPAETFFTRGPKPPQRLEHEMGVTEAQVDLSSSPRIEFVENKPPKLSQSIPRNVRRQLGMR